MQAGNLNRRIEIQKQTEVRLPSGQPKLEWTVYKRVWAWVKGATGMASVRQSGLQDNVAGSLNSYSFRIRYRADITNAMRIAYGGFTFDIKQVRHDLAGHEWTDLVCEEGKP